MAMRIKKVKCPRCKKKIWANKNSIRGMINNCKLPGVCSLERVAYNLDYNVEKPALLLPPPEESENDTFEFELPEPIMIHIVSATIKYSSE